MAFFDNIGKQISNVTQNVAQQTKNLADVTQLNGVISDKRGKIQQLYLSLGQAYYEVHKDDSAAEEVILIQQINALFSEISQCREKISQIRGSDVCPGCGREVPAEARFCNFCGFKIEKDVPPPSVKQGKLCPQCGVLITEGNLFCTQCGTKL